MSTLTAQAGPRKTYRPASSWILPLVIVAAGVYLRVLFSAETYLNPDEAYHFFLANRDSIKHAYQATLGSAHPPLLILLLYYLRQVSSSELVLRLPSVVAGGLFCWAVYKWLNLITGRTAAMIGLLLAAFSPSLVALGSEVRQYSLLLLFMAAALYYLERSLQSASPRLVIIAALFEVLALLTHYSALLFVVALGLYSLSRIDALTSIAESMAAWIAGQAAILGTIAVLYVTHIRRLAATGAPEAIAATYLESTLFNPAKTNFFVFGCRATFRLFHYLFSQPVVAACLVVLYGVGLFALWRRSGEDIGPAPRRLSLLLAVAPVLNYLAALRRAYPYGGTRHSVWLAIFVIAGASFGMTAIRGRRQAKWAAAALLMAVCYLAPHPLGAFIRPANQRRRRMLDAVAYIHQNASPGSVFLLDNQSNFAFRYYFCRDKTIDFDVQAPAFVEFQCGDYRVTAPMADKWMFTPATLPAAASHAARIFGLPAGQRIWFFQSGWTVDAEPALRAEMRDLGCSSPTSFGANIVVCELLPDLR